MKFQDIPQFTISGGYQVHIPLKHLERTIQEFIEDSDLQLEPDFQRGHIWTTEQQTAYVQFILRGGESSRVCYFNHPNWQIRQVKDPEFVCVDGLQRITACLKFINNELPVFDGHYYNDFEDSLPMTYGLLFNVNDLKTRAEVLTWYLEINAGGTIHSQSELNRVKALLEAELAS